jgi:hypothetical protein
MIHLKAITICAINGGAKKKTIRFKRLKLEFDNQKELEDFRFNREQAFNDSDHEVVTIHLQTIDK